MASSVDQKRESILVEIRRLANDSGGVAPGSRQFESATGIPVGQWRGVFWTKWSEALAEAGVTPNARTAAIPVETLLAHLADLTLRYGRFPTQSETRIARRADRSFPDLRVFDNRLGNYGDKIAKLREFARSRPEYAGVAPLLPEGDSAVSEVNTPDAGPTVDGYVYMLKHGRHFKIGKTYSVPRRHREIALELPEKPDAVHSIRTDDPDGIEAYWHRRFADKRTNGEWFALDAAEVRAFKRRKFM
jgi:Meiotically up-regulated gene 113